ncbi:EF-P lysine aminoacylase GenX [Devosia pacifica]|uniref:EF-P lysine aminoacylase GenX n=2 Tax=Devosia pacifica TaxID=1335967 RepID=A0A918SGU2_9HYPH|nr:EF-P lysine aminoacylase GenX [Devosia pacifica]
MRSWFDAEGFIETDVAALAVSPGNEAHLHGFATDLVGYDGQTQLLYLHTSPEFACKKLLSAGEERIYFLGPVWRNRERGPLHHPEFTMAEWYRAGEDYQVITNDVVALIRVASETTGIKTFSYNEQSCDPFAEPERLGVVEAFERLAAIDLACSLGEDGETDREALAAEARSAGIRVADDDGWADIFSRVLVERVEPHLGVGRPTILDRYPSAEAALARPLAGDLRLSERFEVYCCGVEMANGFGELTNPATQRTRFEQEMLEKQRVYGERYPIDEDFLAALSCMPAASGVALGFDRLAMLATGARRIDDILWAPVPEAR